jgi:hypothetical protein
MPVLTSPDNLPYPLPGEPAAPMQEPIEDLAVASQLALAKRQRFSYDWADDAARLAQTGMVQGSEGYVRSNKTNWLYDGGSWKLALAHAEFMTVKNSFPQTTVTKVGVFTLDAANSTSTTMAVAGTDGVIRIADPGMYAISTVSVMLFGTTGTTAQAATGRTFADMTLVSGMGDLVRTSVVINEDRVSMSLPNLRIINPDTPVYFEMFRQVTEPVGRITTRVRVSRIG